MRGAKSNWKKNDVTSAFSVQSVPRLFVRWVVGLRVYPP
jgi:hypothetical protein